MIERAANGRGIFERRHDEHRQLRSHSAQMHAYKRGLENAIAKQVVNGQKDDEGRQLLWFVRDEGTPA